MLDHAFRRRREIERMLLSGKKLTVAELMGRYCVGRKSISRDFEVIGKELPIVSKQGYNGWLFPDGRRWKKSEYALAGATGMFGKTCCFMCGKR